MAGNRSNIKKEGSKDFAYQLGLLLQEARLNSKIKVSQKDMAAVSGFSRTHIGNCELGKSTISAEILYAYCRLFELNPNDLFAKINTEKMDERIKTIKKTRKHD